jgi:hypothetical protein
MLPTLPDPVVVGVVVPLGIVLVVPLGADGASSNEIPRWVGRPNAAESAIIANAESEELVWD